MQESINEETYTIVWQSLKKDKDKYDAICDPVGLKIYGKTFKVLQDDRLVVQGQIDCLWIIEITGHKTKVRRIWCNHLSNQIIRIFEFKNFLIVNDSERVRFFDTTLDTAKDISTISTITDASVVKSAGWLAIATEKGLFSLDLTFWGNLVTLENISNNESHFKCIKQSQCRKLLASISEEAIVLIESSSKCTILKIPFIAPSIEDRKSGILFV